MDFDDEDEMEFSIETRAKKRTKKNVEKVTAEWNNDTTSALIAAVEERSVLWNVGASDYKLPKPDAWREVAEALQNKYDWEECKAKWAHLRITFNANLAKMRKTKSGQGTADLISVQWPFYKSMYFIEASKAKQSTESTSNLNIVSVKFIFLRL